MVDPNDRTYEKPSTHMTKNYRLSLPFSEVPNSNQSPFRKYYFYPRGEFNTSTV
jgi:hypothetical protein